MSVLQFNHWLKSLSVFLVASFVFIPSGHSQEKAVKQIVTVSGGDWGNDDGVKFGTYHPLSNKFHHFDTVPGNFTKAAVVDGDIAYLSADTMVYKYNLNTHQQMKSVSIPGVQDMTIYNNKLIVSRGGAAASSNFVQVYDKNSLFLIDEDSTLTQKCAQLDRHGDSVYVSMPGGFGNRTDTGKVAVFNANTNQYSRTLKFDTFANPVSDVAADAENVYAISPYKGYDPYTKGYMGTYRLSQDTFRTRFIGTNGKLINLYNNKLYGLYFFRLRYYNTVTRQVEGSALYGNYVTGSYDTTNGEFYVTRTDWGSWGSLIRLSGNGSVMDSLNIGIAPEAMAVDYQTPKVSPQPDTVMTKMNQKVGFPLMKNDVLQSTTNYSLTITGGPYNGAITQVAADSFVYMPDSGFAGIDVLEYRVCDSLYPQTCREATAQITVQMVEGLQDRVQNKGFVLFPNPVQDHLRIRLQERPQNPVTVTVRNVAGQTILQTEQKPREQLGLNTRDWQSGVYMVELRTSEKVLGHQKVIKQ